MEKNNENTCDKCGASLQEYWHSLTPGLISALTKLLKAVHFYGRNKIHIHNEMKAAKGADFQLTDHEWNNFTKLRFNGLVAKFDSNTTRSGYWVITRKGARFLRGEADVPRGVKTYRNQVIDHTEDFVNIKDFKGKIPYFETEFASEIHREVIETKKELMPLALFPEKKL